MNNLLNNKGDSYEIKKQLISSYTSGLTASLITLPLWTLRTRISLITLDKIESRQITNRFNLFILTVKESIQKEGVLKLYKGVFSSVVLSFHGGIQMTIYETGKQMIISKNKEIKNSQGSFLGVMSKITASTLLYPFNVIRARQQQFSDFNINERLKNRVIVTNKRYGLFLNTTKIIYNSNGIKGFYNGLLPTVLRQIPGSSVFFYTYEYILKLFNN